MELLSTALNAAVVAAMGLVLAWLGKRQFEALQSRMVALERRIDGLELRMDGFQASLDSMRSDLVQVALAVGAHPRAEND